MSNKSKDSTLKKSQIVSFSSAMAGQNIMLNFVQFYFMIYLTDVLELNPASVGIVFLVARLWDAINDPIMGAIVDRTNTKIGKCRPYLLFTTLPMAIMTVLLFWMPESASYNFKLIYVWIVYITWGMLYTATDIPIWTLSGLMSKKSQDRNALIGYARTAANVGTLVVVASALTFKDFFGKGDDAKGYFLTAIAFCLLGFLLMFQAGIFTREIKTAPPKNKLTVKTSITAIIGNSQLLIILASLFLSVFEALPIGGVIYFTTYVLGNEDLMVPILAVTMIATALGTLIVPSLTKRFESKRILMFSAFLFAPIAIVTFFLGYENMIVIYIYAFFLGFFSGIPSVLRSTMLANTVEWDQMKSGVRNDGIIFSTLTLVGKFMGSISGFLLGYILVWIGYQPNIEQSDFTKQGLLAVMVLAPALGSLLSLIPLYWYKIDDKTHSEMIEKLSKDI